MSELKLAKPVLVGWSYLGYVAMDYVREYGPQSVRGVVLAGSHGGLLSRAPAMGPPPVGDLEAVQSGGRQFMSMMSSEPTAPEAYDHGYSAYMMMPPYARKAMRGKRLDNTDLVAGGVGAQLRWLWPRLLGADLPPPRARAPVDPVPYLTVRRRIPPHGPSQFKIAAGQFQAANQGSRVRCRAGLIELGWRAGQGVAQPGIKPD